jgi:peptidoglycan/xylan/chitin deacetylase (PgdA/CDA1 family)
VRLSFWPVAVSGATAVAAGVAAWGAVHSTSEIFGSTLHHTRRRGEVALTFDDGPNPAITPQLLALLERHSVQASFFLVGRFARACPELVREIAARGHALGNHTETHPNLALLGGTRVEQEVRRGSDSIAEALRGAGRAPAWMRPPFGYRGPQVAGAVRRAGLRGVAMWSLKFYDWRPQPASRLIGRLGRLGRLARVDRSGRSGRCVGAPSAGVSADGGEHTHGVIGSVPAAARNRDLRSRDAHGGEVVLLHDGDFRGLGADQRHVLVALEYWLPRWQDAGLEFVTIDELADTMPARVSRGGRSHG